MISKQKGFNLLEVMIALLLVGFGSLALVKLQTYAEQKADFAQHSLEALYFAEQKLEWLSARGASSASSSIVSFDLIAAGSEVVSSASMNYTLTWSVPPAMISSSLKTITIDATWDDRLANPQKVQLKTMLSKYSEF